MQNKVIIKEEERLLQSTGYLDKNVLRNSKLCPTGMLARCLPSSLHPPQSLEIRFRFIKSPPLLGPDVLMEKLDIFVNFRLGYLKSGGRNWLFPEVTCWKFFAYLLRSCRLSVINHGGKNNNSTENHGFDR